jgi:molybdopterin synthase sulfur carrier subunit
MAITVKYFAVLREQAGKSEESIDFEEGMTAADVWKKSMSEDGLPPRLMVAVNLEYTRADTVIRDGDEVAFFPAVTGG